jgi:predicted RNA-binding protein with PUA-like domain
MKYWLMKSEPHVFSFEDLQRLPNQLTFWEGVRNYQARNFMRDEMRTGDIVLFYHSSCATPGIYGLAQIDGPAIPDLTALDPASDYFDPRATRENPRWVMVPVRFFRDLQHPILLKELRTYPEIATMRLLQPGQRLSIQPVLASEFDFIFNRLIAQ